MKVWSRLLFCILTKDPFFVCFCLNFSWIKQSSPSYHDLLLGERTPLVKCSSVMLLFLLWGLFLWITMDHGWEHLQWNKPMTGMAESCHVEIIILMGNSAALSHFLEEVGWGKYGGRKHDLFFRFSLSSHFMEKIGWGKHGGRKHELFFRFSLSFCVFWRWQTGKDCLRKNWIFLWLKRSRIKTEELLIRLGLAYLSLSAFLLIYFNVLLILFLKISSFFYNHRIK